MGTNLEIKVPEDVTRDTLAFTQRLLGPVAEVMDFLGDRIRFYRWKSMVRTLKQAEEIASANNIESRKVPLKFFVPFLERASLEGEDSELTEKWANLLVAASKSYRDEHHTFASVLAEISSADARKLKQLLDNADPVRFLMTPGVGGLTQLEAVRIKLQGFVQQHKDEPSVKTFNDLRERISDYLAPFGAQLVFSFVDDLVGHQLGLDENPERDFANLERQRLVRLEDCTVDSFDGDLMGQIRFFQLTEFGFNFTATCEGRDPVNDLSEETTRRGS